MAEKSEYNLHDEKINIDGPRDNEADLQCDICLSSSTRHNDSKGHVAKQTDEKPFKCDHFHSVVSKTSTSKFHLSTDSDKKSL